MIVSFENLWQDNSSGVVYSDSHERILYVQFNRETAIFTVEQISREAMMHSIGQWYLVCKDT